MTQSQTIEVDWEPMTSSDAMPGTAASDEFSARLNEQKRKRVSPHFWHKTVLKRIVPLPNWPGWSRDIRPVIIPVRPSVSAWLRRDKVVSGINSKASATSKA